MEILGLVSLPGWLVVVLTPIIMFLIYSKYKQTYFSRIGIKQKPTTFVLGDFVPAIKLGNAFFRIENVGKYGKVYGMYFGNAPALVINDPDILQHIFVKDFSNFTNRTTNVSITKRWEGAITLAEDSHWKFLRTTISPTFSTSKMKQMDPYIHRCLKGLHEILEEKRMAGEDMDIDPILHGYTMDIICSVGFGLEVNSQRNPDDPFVKHGEALSKFNPASLGFLIGFFLPDLRFLQKLFKTENASKEDFDFFKSATTAAFEDRKKSNSVLVLDGPSFYQTHRDLLQLLINSHKDTETSDTTGFTLEDYKKRGLTDEEVLVNSIIFMLAGYQTTAATLLWLLYDLTINPDCQERLRDEINTEIGEGKLNYDSVFKLKYLDMVVKETLRVHPPANRLVRVGSEDTEICGLKIPKDLMLLVLPSVLHFMEEYWDRPHEYIPDRFAPENKDNINEFAYCPFGNGPRNCVGMRLALLEVKITLVSILQKYRVHKSDKLQVPMPSIVHGIDRPGKPVFVKLEKV